MPAGLMKGCDSCSALVYAEDAFCPTCGAGVQEAGKVRIPVRRHGVVPPPPSGYAYEAPGPAPARRRGVAAVAFLVSAVAAAAIGAVLYRFW